MPDPFISRDDLGDYLGQSLTSSDKALICVDAACDIVRTLTEQTFNAGTTTLTLDGTGTDALLLPERPVLTAGTVIESGGTLTLDEDYVIGGAILYRKPGLIDNGWGTETLRTYWWPGRQNIEVTYSHGYATDDIPRDIRMVALSIAARLFNEAAGNITSETLGEYSVRYSDTGSSDLTFTEKTIVAKYRQAK